jgi:hypothetical protein
MLIVKHSQLRNHLKQIMFLYVFFVVPRLRPKVSYMLSIYATMSYRPNRQSNKNIIYSEESQDELLTNLLGKNKTLNNVHFKK